MRAIRSAFHAWPIALLAAAIGAASAQVTTVECALGLVTDRRTTPSSGCMTCHDGSKAVDARSGHRYDIEYLPLPGKDLRADPEGFNALSANVVLGIGKTVTCLTCHDPASKLLYHLAGPTDGPSDGRLCVACHVM